MICTFLWRKIKEEKFNLSLKLQWKKKPWGCTAFSLKFYMCAYFTLHIYLSLSLRLLSVIPIFLPNLQTRHTWKWKAENEKNGEARLSNLTVSRILLLGNKLKREMERFLQMFRNVGQISANYDCSQCWTITGEHNRYRSRRTCSNSNLIKPKGSVNLPLRMLKILIGASITTETVWHSIRSWGVKFQTNESYVPPRVFQGNLSPRRVLNSS